MLNWENVKQILGKGAETSVETNAALLNQIAQTKAEMAEVEGAIISLQDMALLKKEFLHYLQISLGVIYLDIQVTK